MGCTSTPSIDICPAKADIVPQLLALLPRGRAWSRHDGGPFPGDRLYQFWTAVAAVFAYANQRMCDLRREFFCATVNETRDVWMAEYGLPDGCDAYPDLCTKVAAQGDPRCEFYVAVAARAGWDIECVTRAGRCGASVGALGGRARAGCMQPGRRSNSVLEILVHSATSAAFVAGPRTPSKAGRLRAGRPLSCAPDLTGLVCLLERIVHAEILISYEVV